MSDDPQPCRMRRDFNPLALTHVAGAALSQIVTGDAGTRVELVRPHVAICE